MKFSVAPDVINEAVSWTAKILPIRPRQPYLAGIKIEAQEDGTVIFAGFDTTVTSMSTIVAQVEESGTILVSGKLLSEISRQLPNKSVTFALEGNLLVITCGSARFNILIIPLDDYPKLPEIPPKLGVITSTSFAKAANQAVISASTDPVVPQLTAVKTEFSKDEIVFLSTDRYRLTMREIEWEPENKDIDLEVLIDARFLSDVAKNLAGSGNVDIYLDPDNPTNIGFSSGGKQTIRTLVEGNYPPVRQLFPEESTTKIVLSTEELQKSIKRVSLVADRGSAVRITFSEGEVKLEAGHGDNAQASEVIPATLYGEEIITAFKADFLLDGLQIIDFPYTRLSFTTPLKPSVLTGQKELDGEDNQDYKYLLMPIRYDAS